MSANRHRRGCPHPDRPPARRAEELSAADLGGVAIKGALEKAGVSGDQVDYVIMGQVIQAGAGQNPARTGRGCRAACPMSVPSITINKVCLSGPQRHRHGRPADPCRRGRDHRRRRHGVDDQRPAPAAEVPRGLQVRRHRAGRLDGLRRALRPGHPAGDGRADRAVQRRGHRSSPARSRTSSRPARHQRAAEAWKNGVFDEEVVPVEIPQRKGDPVVVGQDEGVRGDTTAESLGKLRPAFSKEGTITAGSSSQISDGACAVVVMSKAKAEELGLEWLAEIGAHGQVAGPDSTLQLQPANATAKACEKEGIAPADLDLVEFNEAFAAVGIESAREPRPVRGQGQRQRRRDRAGPPGRDVRRPRRAAPRAGAQAPWRRHRRRRAVRRRRPGRRPDRACPVELSTSSRTSSSAPAPARSGPSRG